MFSKKSFSQTLTLFIATVLCVGNNYSQNTTPIVSYELLLSDATANTRGMTNSDEEVSAALKVISAGGPEIYVDEIAGILKRNMPEVDKNLPIKLWTEARTNMITKGEEYERLLRVTGPLFKFCGIEGKVFPVLYKSEQPVVAISYPKAIIFSTRAMALLNDDELEAMFAHEIGHLVGRDIFVSATVHKDDRALRLIELFCDGVAAVLLEFRGKNPQRVITGLSKMQQVLELEYGELDRPGKHPAIKTRATLNAALIAKFKRVARK